MKHKSCFIAVWLDSVRFKDREELTYLKSLDIKKHLTQPSYLLEYTFFTGKTPIEHDIMFETIRTKDNYALEFTNNKLLNKGIWAVNNLTRWKQGKTRLVMQSKIPKQFRSELGSSVEKQFLDFNAIKFEGLPDIFQKNGLKFEMYDWPTKSTNQGIKLDFTTTNNDDNKMKNFIEKIKEGKSHFYFIHIWGLDTVQHYHVGNSKAKQKLKEYDNYVYEILKAANETFNFVDLLVWSDHGMVPIIEKVNIIQELDLKYDQDEYIFFLDGTHARFWFKNQAKKKEFEEKLKLLEDKGEILTDAMKKKQNLSLNSINGELIWRCKPGYVLHPNFYEPRPDLKGMHGYSSDSEENSGIIAANFKIDKKEVKSHEIFNIILKRLNLI